MATRIDGWSFLCGIAKKPRHAGSPLETTRIVMERRRLHRVLFAAGWLLAACFGFRTMVLQQRAAGESAECTAANKAPVRDVQRSTTTDRQVFAPEKDPGIRSSKHGIRTLGQPSGSHASDLGAVNAGLIDLSGLSTAFIPLESSFVEHWTGGWKRRWGHEQAAGEPDTGQAGDIPTAWASKLPDGGEEWLQLDYEREVQLQQINVLESHNPGAIRKVVAILADGREVPVWEGTMESSGADELVSSVFPVTGEVRARTVKVYLDTARVPGWNEIDAVQVIGSDGSTQWAAGSRASSSYADP